MAWPFCMTAWRRKLAALFFLGWLSGGAAEVPSPGRAATPTFNRDIAPIIFGHCVECHHPDGNAPFSLATYADVMKRAKSIARLTETRQMPPWPPEAGYGHFVGERRLTAEQIALLDQWWKAGTPQGAAEELKVTAKWTDDWSLGKPDLIVTLPEPYLLPAEGMDVYRNFVIRNAVPSGRFLRAAEFRPGKTSAIHHAFVLFDETGAARRRDAADAEPGFPGMDPGGAVASQAMFISWQPGKRAVHAPAGAAAIARKTTDLVLQVHMRPTGKPEQIQPTLALYFADQPPTRSPVMVLLRSVEIDVPPGAQDYAIESSYQLPVDVELLAVLPHMHYLGKEARAWAELPGGERQDLIYIKQWDFNWQGDYQYAEPVSLPKGTTLRMRCIYDNSAANPRNPNHPPKRVRYGLQSSDEMGEMTFQFMPRIPADAAALSADVMKNVALPDAIAFAKVMLRANPDDAARRANLGAALALSGQTKAAVEELEHAVFDDPNLAQAHYVLGQIAMRQQDARKARRALMRAAELDPDNPKIHNDLGMVLLAMGQADSAIEHLTKAVELNPNDPLPRSNLTKARAMATPR
jgi:tetratricopeptide (TPR) repeat protein